MREWLIEARKKKGLTQVEVATKSGIAVSAIAQPTVETLISGMMMCFVGAMCAYQGYESGFKNIVEDTVLYVERQINLLTQFIMWSGRDISSIKSMSQVIQTDDPS